MSRTSMTSRCRLAAITLVLAVACSKESNVSVSQGADAGVPVGDACATEADCADGVCLLGFCRLPCDGPSDCDDGKVCLSADGRQGCRLAAELTCPTPGQPCAANQALTCALDQSCRLPCATACDGTGERCLAGTCVSPDEAGTGDTWFSCDSGRSCRDVAGGSELTSCNETTPGVTVLATCATAPLCEQGLADGRCAEPGCAAGDTRCSSATLQRCRSDGSGWDSVLPACASQALCEATRAQTSPTACVAPACGAGEVRCRDGRVETCAPGLDAFQTTQTCSAPDAQCSPTAAACVALGIDATEVTRAAYAAFLAAGTPPTAPPGCAGNVSLAPDPTCAAAVDVCQGAGCDAHPQTCVDWCDAWAFCAAQGRRLCGAISAGTTLTPADFDDAGASAWMNACTSGGQRAYPYGDQQDNAACKGRLFQPNTTVPAGSLTTCQSNVPGYAGVLDLSGNAAEWEDACDLPASSSTAGAADGCRVRGGSYLSDNAALACGALRTESRGSVHADVGFRCCD